MPRFIFCFILCVTSFSGAAEFYRQATQIVDFNSKNSLVIHGGGLEGLSKRFYQTEVGKFYLYCNESGWQPYLLKDGDIYPKLLWEKKSTKYNCAGFPKVHQVNEHEVVFAADGPNLYISNGTQAHTRPLNLIIPSFLEQIVKLTNNQFIVTSYSGTRVFFTNETDQQEIDITKTLVEKGELGEGEKLSIPYHNGAVAILKSDKRIWLTDGTLTGTKQIYSVTGDYENITFGVFTNQQQDQQNFIFYKRYGNEVLNIYLGNLQSQKITEIIDNENRELVVPSTYSSPSTIVTDSDIYFTASSLNGTSASGTPIRYADFYKFNIATNSVETLYSDVLKEVNSLQLHALENSILVTFKHSELGYQFYQYSKGNGALEPVENISIDNNKSRYRLIGTTNHLVYLESDYSNRPLSKFSVYNENSNSMEHVEHKQKADFWSVFLHDDVPYFFLRDDDHTIHQGHYRYNPETGRLDHVFNMNRQLSSQHSNYKSRFSDGENLVATIELKEKLGKDGVINIPQHSVVNIKSAEANSIIHGDKNHNDYFDNVYLRKFLNGKIFTSSAVQFERNIHHTFDTQTNEYELLYDENHNDLDDQRLLNYWFERQGSYYVESYDHKTAYIDENSQSLQIIEAIPTNSEVYRCADTILFRQKSSGDGWQQLQNDGSTATINPSLDFPPNQYSLDILFDYQQNSLNIYDCDSGASSQILEIELDTYKIMEQTKVVGDWLYFIIDDKSSPVSDTLNRLHIKTKKVEKIYAASLIMDIESFIINQLGVFWLERLRVGKPIGVDIHQIIDQQKVYIGETVGDWQFTTSPQDPLGWMVSTNPGNLMKIFMPEKKKWVDMDIVEDTSLVNELNPGIEGMELNTPYYTNGHLIFPVKITNIGKEAVVISQQCLLELLDGVQNCTSGYKNTPPKYQNVIEPSLPVGSYVYIPIRAYDIDADPLHFTIENQPNWLTIDSSTGEIKGKVPEIDSGTVYFDVVISDGYETVRMESISIEIEDSDNQDDSSDGENTDNSKQVEENSKGASGGLFYLLNILLFFSILQRNLKLKKRLY